VANSAAQAPIIHCVFIFSSVYPSLTQSSYPTSSSPPASGLVHSSSAARIVSTAHCGEAYDTFFMYSSFGWTPAARLSLKNAKVWSRCASTVWGSGKTLRMKDDRTPHPMIFLATNVDKYPIERSACVVAPLKIYQISYKGNAKTLSQICSRTRHCKYRAFLENTKNLRLCRLVADFDNFIHKGPWI
ncbi:MAG: hypothetical protein J5871_04735, partial [Bacteroidales bacterium]|nr:hypothetical protein [Bacteroidales bacterium]